ncbi:4'-phosphopantetheinyl transferase family protein [Sporomusa sp.]|uniref:4'-phosphopantetheinyl transferase family protein n=1 Tax=Sporomusa sp. TaxID=2078658 RepID=UPI002D81126E|nr:4'-phosphopantetheinyl transferase superfamily protein [Sporomusa sp.]
MSFFHIREFTEDQFVLASPMVLANGHIHLWWVCTQTFSSSARVKELGHLLSAEETSRMSRFYFQQDRLRFAVAHGILRILAGRYLNIPPGLVRFRQQPNGKPELAGVAGASFSFNLAHSHQLVVLAFSRFPCIGVDVEFIRPMPDCQQIVDTYFHDRERAMIQCSPLSYKEKAFFDCWTRKEAFVKATGEGLSRPLNSFFTATDSEPETGMFSVGGTGDGTADWKLLPFMPAPGYAGAVVFTA